MAHEDFINRAKASLDAEPTNENLDRWMDADHNKLKMIKHNKLIMEAFYGDHARMHSVLRLRLIFNRCAR